MDDYKKAAKVGLNEGECWSFYPDCPFSIFNVIPDVYTETERFNVTFDSFGSGSSLEKNQEEAEERLREEFGKVKPVKIDLDLTPK